MIKLLIVDDEKIIRETISQLIDWEQLGITLIGCAENGVEALNIILDESPEIVMTDIRMPGLSGLELIRQIYELNHETKFIILTGYSEFEYAKEAMSYGIRHYLLKPCNESQIISAIHSVTNEIRQELSCHSDEHITYSLIQGILFNIISEAFTGASLDFHRIYSTYSKFLDMNNYSYTLHYIFYLEHNRFPDVMETISKYIRYSFPKLFCFYIYVENTLVIFHASDLHNDKQIASMLDKLSFPCTQVTPVLNMETYPSLSSLLDKLLPRIIRYETIYFKMFNSILPVSNTNSVIHKIDKLLTELLHSAENSRPATAVLDQLENLFLSVHSLNLIHQAGNITVTKILAEKSLYASINMDEITEFCKNFYQCTDSDDARILLCSLLKKMLIHPSGDGDSVSLDIASKVMNYINSNLSDSSLSLKSISENILFMNPDYVSKRFIKETGEKFSQYLTRARMEYAKKLLLSQKELNVQEIAFNVGYGNSPLYFSQLFKKYTQMTPSNYFRFMKEKGESHKT